MHFLGLHFLVVSSHGGDGGGGDGGGGDGGGGQSHFTGSRLSMFRRSSIGKSGSPIHWSGVRVRVRGLGSRVACWGLHARNSVGAGLWVGVRASARLRARVRRKG